MNIVKLKKKEALKLYGRATLTATDPKTGKVVKVVKSENLIVTVGQAFIGNMLIDLNAQHDTGITYCALGANNGAPALAETQLVDEGGGAAMRKAVTSKTQAPAPNTNQFTWSTFFTAAESTLAIEEAGMFGSSTAGAAENSGIMFSRWLVSFDNSGALYDITIDYVLTIG